MGAAEILITLAYLVASALFIFGIKGLTSPKTAVRGIRIASFGMLIAVVVTLLQPEILDPLRADEPILTGVWWILGGLLLGGVIGAVAAVKVEMTAMPEMVAIFNGFGGGASAVVAAAELYKQHAAVLNAAGADASVTLAGLQEAAGGPFASTVMLIAMSLSALIGSVTLTGSFIAYGKLSGKVTSAPYMLPLQNVIFALFLLGGFGLCAWMVIDPTQAWIFWTLFVVAGVLGVLLTMPIGGADMPVVVSLLNSYSGLAAAMTGFVLGNTMLIIAGSLVGASGLILTAIMCKAMNRSLTNVLFGGFGTGDAGAGGGGAAIGERPVRQGDAESAAMVMAYSESMIIVPGYGLAVAQAQHACWEFASALMEKGVKVRFAIHPVAGRMPGHMNVLLAEADVPYDLLIEMENINPEFPQTDVALVVGANDVVNPAARDDPSSPIAGMPILEVDKAKNCFVIKRSLSPGFAGIDNELFYMEHNTMLFGDAKQMLQDLTTAVQEA